MAFGFASIGHALASVAHDIVKAAKWVAGIEQKIQAQAPLIEALSGIVSPQAAAIERGAFACLGIIASAVHDAGDAAAANGLDIKLDAQLVADVKAILPELQKALAAAGIKL